METLILRGQQRVLLVIGTTLAADLISTGIGPLTGEPIDPLIDGGRFILTLLFCLALYQGWRWVRWVYGALLGLGAVLTFITGLAMLRLSPIGISFLGIAVLHLTCLGAIFGTPANTFFAYRRHRRLTTVESV
jgi:hypothetical protein